MNDMRFSPPPRKDPDDTISKREESYGQKSESRMSKFKINLKVLFLAFLILVVVGLAWFVFKNKNNFANNANAVSADVSASPYYAVFLNSGQVYFGKLVSKNQDEFVLSDVYYLKTPEVDPLLMQQQTEDQRFVLLKLEDEAHGPTDQLFINNDNVLFYEQLSKDSKVVKSIGGRD